MWPSLGPLTPSGATQSDWAEWCSWCRSEGLDALPASALAISRYRTSLASHHLAPGQGGPEVGQLVGQVATTRPGSARPGGPRQRAHARPVACPCWTRRPNSVTEFGLVGTKFADRSSFHAAMS